MVARTDSAPDREIVMTRVFDAPREMVFKAWTDPEQVPRWWGPRGFTTTTYAMEVKPGGVWRYCMHGPDGRDYQNKVTFLEVVRPERLVFKGEKDGEPVSHQSTVTFEEEGPGRTRLTMRMVFRSAAEREHIVKTYGAIEGGKQHLERLAEHLAKTGGNGGDGREFVISRVFDAPRELVFKAWTERERLMRWFGPKGVTISTATLDLRPGGVFHYCMRGHSGGGGGGVGGDIWGKWTFREIKQPDCLVFITSFSDEAGGLTRHPFAPDWPREMLTRVTFDEHAGVGRGTLVTIRWAPVNPTDAERRTFEAGFDSMNKGWTGTFERLTEYLVKT